MKITALGMIAFAASILIMAGAIEKMASMNIEKVRENINEMATIMLAITAVALAASHVRLRNAIGMLGLIGSILLIEFALQKVIDSGVNLDQIRANLSKFVVVLGTMVIVSAIMAAVGRSGASIGAAAVILAFAVAIQSVIKVMDKLRLFSLAGIGKSVLGMIGICISLGILMSMTEIAGKHAHKAALVLVAMGVAATLLAGVVKTLDEVAKSGADIIAIAGILALIGVISIGLVAATSLSSQAKVGPILAMIAGLVAVVYAIVTLYNFATDINKLIFSATAIAIGLIGLAGAIGLVCIAASGINISSILVIAASVAALAASVAGIAYLANIKDPEAVMSAALAIAMVMGTLAAVAHYADASLQTAGALLLMSVPLLAAALR